MMYIEEIRIGQTVYFIKDDEICSFKVMGILEGATDWRICSCATSTQTTYTKLVDCHRDKLSAKTQLLENFRKTKQILEENILVVKQEINNIDKNINKLLGELNVC